MIKCIGYHISNGLRLARTRRSMKDKALSFGRFHNRRQLGRIKRKRHTHIAWFKSFVQINGTLLFRSRYDIILHQCINDRTFTHLFTMRMDIIPHHELTETEYSDHTFFQHIPIRFLNQTFTNNVKYLLQIKCIVTTDGFFQPFEFKFISLSEIFKQGYIQQRFFASPFHMIYLVLI